jgi:hypothetical protein
MNINWTAPFELAFELGMFLLGSILVLAIAIVAIVLVYGLIKSLFVTLARARKKSQEKEEFYKLHSVD